MRGQTGMYAQYYVWLLLTYLFQVFKVHVLLNQQIHSLVV